MKGDTVKIDLVTCLIDYETREEVPEDKMFDHFRYSVISNYFGAISKIVHTAPKFKSIPFINPYIPSALYHLMKGDTDLYTAEADGETLFKDLETDSLGINNTKYAG